MAAVLSLGDGAVLSHTSAAVLWALLKPMSGPTHISLPSQNGRASRAGIRVHRLRSLPPSSRTKRLGIPVTTVPRTIADLIATGLEPRLLRRAIREAEHRRHRLSPRAHALTRGTRSDLELDFLVFLEARRLPLPEVNVQIGRYEVDFLWRKAKLAVETDDYIYHHGEVAFEDDRERDLALRAAGFEPLRVTGRQLEENANLVEATLRSYLSQL